MNIQTKFVSNWSNSLNQRHYGMKKTLDAREMTTKIKKYLLAYSYFQVQIFKMLMPHFMYNV